MKRRIIKILLLVICIGVLIFYLFILGGPIERTLVAGECKTNFTYYITNNQYCNLITRGHCPDNNFEIFNAEHRIGYCLCEKFESSKNAADSITLIEFINSNKRIKNSYEHITGQLTSKEVKANELCKNKDELFEQIGIE